jgi:hypothetical protein
MYTDEDLYAAVKVGIFQEASVEQFRNYILESKGTMPADEENFKLISGFNDIFVAIASLLLLGSAGWLGSYIAPPLGFLISAGIAWFLSVYFVLKKKLALPGIIFLVAFVSCVAGCVYSLLNYYGVDEKIIAATASGFGVLAAWLHWRKFKVPITVAAGAASFVTCFILFLLSLFEVLREHLMVFILLGGVAVFLLAMYWDSRDTERKTRKSDVAFWLHLLAAPLIVHPIFNILEDFNENVSVEIILVVITLYLLLGLVSVLVDRKALMVSALAYVVIALATLFESYGALSLSFSIAGTIIGALLLLLSSFWHKCRVKLLGFTPVSFKQYLPGIKLK